MTETPAPYTIETLPTESPGGSDAVGEWCAQLGIEGDNAAYKVKVYRLGTKGRAWMFDTSPYDTGLMETLRDAHDGGQFELVVYGDKGIHSRHTVTIEPPKLQQPPAQALSGADVLAMLRETQQQTLAQVKLQ